MPQHSKLDRNDKRGESKHSISSPRHGPVPNPRSGHSSSAVRKSCEPHIANEAPQQHHKFTPQHLAVNGHTIKYGELVVLGYNGGLSSGDKGRRRSKFALLRRETANGVKRVKQHVVKNAEQCELIKDSKQHSVSFTLNRNRAIIVQYDQDESTDMFQIGRSSEGPIDFVVMDTVAGSDRSKSNISVTQSTISRFACRIIVDRNPPFTARLFAAGFDSHRNIFLGEKAIKWHQEESSESIDGLTTNGVLMMTPREGFTAATAPNVVWREVSVGGGIYALRESRSTPQKSSLIPSERNILKDGTLIDLCGATLIWRSAVGLLASPSRLDLECRIDEINAGRPQCPVGLNTLVLPGRQALSPENGKQPYVYMECGHVHGQHSWGHQNEEQSSCPMCRKTGAFVKVQMGTETSFYVDSDVPTFCFCPCGHVASEKTTKYWASLPIPHGCHGFRPACPFCASPLTPSSRYVKLIFQDHVD